MEVKGKTNSPKYSVCVCNYNMGDTIEEALTSVIEQLNECYEVVVVDDGSSDDSVEKLEKLSLRYNMLRYIALDRASNRLLGETRNISIKEAIGEYVLLHVDADDIWKPYIQDFVSVFHNIEACFGRDILLSGQQINMAKREFLLSHGPYRNIYRGEDYDLFHRLASIGAYIPIDHKLFRERLSRDNKLIFFKIIDNIWSHLYLDFVRGKSRVRNILSTFRGVFSSANDWSAAHRVGRLVLFLPAVIYSLFKPKILPPENMPDHASFVLYRDSTRGTYSEIMLRKECNPSLIFLKPDAQVIFEGS